jgi:bacillithiol biosynthesis cysteine-adding enzyme BshC
MSKHSYELLVGGHMRVIKNGKNIFSGIAQNLVCGEDYEDFYNYKIDDDRELERRADFVKSSTFQRENLVNILEAFNESIGAGKKTFENIEKLKDEDSFVVVTGQQAGYFAGPMYTVYKAMTTIKLAREYSEKLNSKVVPVFWIASEDHDFHEVSRVNYSNKTAMKKVKFKKQDDRNISVGNMMIDEKFIYEMKNKMLDVFADDDFESIFLSQMKEGESYSIWFAKIMARLFSDYGLVFIDSMEDDKRHLEKDFFKTAIINNDEVRSLFKSQTSLIVDKGYQPLIVNNENSSNLFIQHMGERIQLLNDDGKFYNEAYGVSYTTEELIKMAENNPEEFSTNVVLRPLVQDFLLPTLAYVAGPGEMKYYGQLKKVYGVFDLEMPIIYPRENFTYISEDVATFMSKYNLDVEKLFNVSKEDFINTYISELNDNQVEKCCESFSEDLLKTYDDMLSSLNKVSSIDKSIIEKNKIQIEKQISYLIDKVNQNIRKEYKDLIKEINLVFDFVYPESGLQERSHSLVSIMDQIDRMFKEIHSIEIDHKHRVIIDTKEA